MSALTLTIVHRLDDHERSQVDQLLVGLIRLGNVFERFATAVERIADLSEPPGLVPAGPMMILDQGATVEFSTMSELPLGKKGIQRLNATAGQYDGPIRWSAAEGDGAAGTVTAADPDGLAGAIEWAPEAAEGEVITMVAEGDRRHGEGVLSSRVEFPVTAIPRDAPPLTGAGFEVVDGDATAAA